MITEKGAIEYDGDNVGPCSIVKEHLKRVKMPGHSLKGKKFMCILPVHCIEMVCVQFVIYQFCFVHIVYILFVYLILCIKEQRE